MQLDSMRYLPNTCTTVSEPINEVWSSPRSDSFFLLEDIVFEG